MEKIPSLPYVSGQMLLAAVLLISTVAFAGCSMNSEYTTSIGEPTTGTVIDDLSVYDINEIDGVRYELNYSLNTSENATYNIEVYELTSGSPEFVSVSDLDRRKSVYRNDVAPPWNAGEERLYEIRVVREANNTVVDAVALTSKREDS